MKKLFFVLISLSLANFSKAQCPSVTVSPISKTLTCNGAPATFTANFSPTTNVTGVWLGPGGSVVNTTSTSPSVLQTSNPGTYTFMATNNTCTTSQTIVVVKSNTIVPQMTITAMNGFTINCNNPAVILQINGSSSIAPTGYTWTNVSTSVSAYPNNGSYTVTSPGYYEATFRDGNFCYISQMILVQIDTVKPTFNISAPSGTVVTCSLPTVPLYANNTSTLSGITYTWTNAVTGTAVGNTVNAISVGGLNTYTVVASASSGMCTYSQTISIAQYTAAPSITVSPISQTITCNGACKSFTAVTTSTTNIVGAWYNSSSAVMNGPAGTPLIMCANAPGTYTAQFCNLINGCCTSQTVAVTASTAIPTITVTPITPNGYTINCASPCVQMVINSSSTLAPTSYSWTSLNTMVTSSPPSGGYTTCVPGQYVAAFKDGNACTVSTTVTVFIDTLRPSPTGVTDLPSSSFTLNCYNSCLVATALTNPMLPASNYSWTVPPNLVQFTPTVNVCFANITSSTSPTSYTVLAMGLNGCVGRQKVNFYKDVYVPYYNAVFTPTVISCASGTISMAPYNITGTTTPVTFTMTSPPPTTFSTSAPATFSVGGTYTITVQNTMNGCTANTTTVVPVSGPCGVNELGETRNIELMPNPNPGRFNVKLTDETDKGVIILFDNTGREVFRQNVSKGNNAIDVHHLAKGMYYYTLSQNKQPFANGKILIE
jgi:hypothetical protein